MSHSDQEFINIGLSHTANHLLTQFYNIEESILHQQRKLNNCRESHNVNLDVKVNQLRKLAYYTPRSILYDTQNSGNYGANWNATNIDDNSLSQYQKIETFNDKVLKSDFQKELDEGKLPKSLIDLDSESDQKSIEFKYWTDYNKFLLKPENLLLSDHWYHNNQKADNTGIPVNLPTDRLGEEDIYVKHFLHAESGKNEYANKKYELWDDKLHHWLERCDSFRHFNIISEFDTAWGYLNNELLQDIKDEFPKTTLFQYSLSCDDPSKLDINQNSKITMFMNNIINTVECLENVSLLLPLSYSSDSSLMFENTSKQSLVFQTINSLFDNSNDKLTPNEVIRKLTFNNNSSSSQQKILSNINVNSKIEFNHIMNFNIPNNFQHGNFKTWKLKGSDKEALHVFGSIDIFRNKNLQSHDKSSTYELDKQFLNSFPTSKSFLDIEKLNLSITNSKRFTNVLKYWLNYTVKNKKNLKNILMMDLDYIEEIIEMQHSLIKSYNLGRSYLDVDGYSISDESDFDD
ncbi:hypothetical protein QEN19_001441 [Hanseniaspora menglaensis]